MSDDELLSSYAGYSDAQIAEFLVTGVPEWQQIQFQRVLRLRRLQIYSALADLPSSAPASPSLSRRVASSEPMTEPPPLPREHQDARGKTHWGTPAEDQPRPAPSVKDEGMWDWLFRAIETRESALGWITLTFWVYVVIATIDMFTGLFPMTIILVIAAACLKFFRSRAAAVILLILSGLAFIVTFSISQYHLTMISLIRAIVTGRSVEATYKLRRADFR